jgi:Meiotically up-regulated gene 113
MIKQHILDEIQRTAAANGGQALGVGRFEQETGIKESDWRGKYWARWGDAVAEAGLSPNRLNSAYDEAHLLKMLADLVRKLGRFPTTSEMQLKRRTDPEFPSDTVYKRFGGKAEQAKRLLEYCLTVPALDDVAALCRAVAVTAQSEDGIDDQEHDDEVQYGFVYLIKSGRHYKIGRSNAAGRREREIALQLPEKANTVHVIRTDDPPGIEAYWHRRFAEKRRNGEWFELEAPDVRAFKRRRFM